MTKSYSLADARAHLKDILDQVETGQEIEITRRGKRVAVVVSPARYARLRQEPVAFWDAYQRFVQDHDLRTVGLDRDWAHGVRDRSAGRPVKI